MWDLSFKKLGERSKLASLIIGTCSFLHPDAILVSLFERQSMMLHLDANFDAIREAVSILVQFSFVRRTTTHNIDIDADDSDDPARDLLAIHRPVQEVICENIIKELGHEPWGELLIKAMKNEVTSKDYHIPHVWKINNVYIPHIRNVLTRLAPNEFRNPNPSVRYLMKSQNMSQIHDPCQPQLHQPHLVAGG
jgi:hypothetical protein